MSFENTKRKELQELCKKHGIKANLTTKEMIKCMDMVVKSKPIPINYRKMSWLDKNKNNILIGLTLYAFLLSVYILKICLSKHSQ